MRKSEKKTATCRVLRGVHNIIGAGKNEKGNDRRFMLLEFHGNPEKDEWQYGDEVVVSLLSKKDRKR